MVIVANELYQCTSNIFPLPVTVISTERRLHCANIPGGTQVGGRTTYYRVEVKEIVRMSDGSTVGGDGLAEPTIGCTEHSMPN